MIKFYNFVFVVIIISTASCSKSYITKIHKPSNEIVLIYIDDKSIHGYGTFPWTRNRYAEFINALYDHYSPKVLYFDILIDLPSKENPSHDLKLFNAAKGKNNIIFCAAVSNDTNSILKYIDNENHYIKQTLPKKNVSKSLIFRGIGGDFPLLGLISNGAHIGISTVIPDKNNQFNNFPILFEVNGKFYFSSVGKVLMLYNNINLNEIKFIDNKLVIGEKNLKLHNFATIKINFNYSFNEFSFIDAANKKIEKGQLNNKIILVGNQATGAGDYLPVEISNRFQATKLVACAVQTLQDWYVGK